jgi:hypothetical protein
VTKQYWSRVKKEWSPIIHDDYYEIPLSQGKYALIDKEDMPIIKDIGWSAIKDGNTYYAVGGNPGIKMHRLILNATIGFYVDHINTDGLDNRKHNLRICTNSQNQAHSRLSVRNTTGFKGVVKRKYGYDAKIIFKGKYYHLGSFRTPEEAHEVYMAKAKELQGVFAYAG